MRENEALASLFLPPLLSSTITLLPFFLCSRFNKLRLPTVQIRARVLWEKSKSEARETEISSFYWLLHFFSSSKLEREKKLAAICLLFFFSPVLDFSEMKPKETLCIRNEIAKNNGGFLLYLFLYFTIWKKKEDRKREIKRERELGSGREKREKLLKSSRTKESS